MPIFCNYCGAGNCTETCPRCPTKYCSVKCINIDKREHSKFCSQSSAKGLGNSGPYVHRSQTSAPAAGNFSQEPVFGYGQSNPKFKLNNNPSETKVYNSRIFKNQNFKKPPSNPGVYYGKSKGVSKSTNKAKPNESFVPAGNSINKTEPKPSKPAAKVYPSEKPQMQTQATKNPEPKPKPIVISKHKVNAKKSSNPFDVLDLDSIDSESEVSEASDSEGKGIPSGKLPVDSMAPEKIYEKPKSGDSQDREISKSEKKRRKKERQKAKAKERKQESLIEYLNAARNQVSLKNLHQAQIFINHASNCNPSEDDKILITKERVAIQMYKGMFQAALQDLKKIIDRHPDDHTAQKQFCDCCLASYDVTSWQTFYSKRKGKELQLFEKTNSKFETLKTSLVNVKKLMKDLKFSEAYNIVEMNLSSNPTSVHLIYLKARILGLGKLDYIATQWFENRRSVGLNAPFYTNVKNMAKGIYHYFSNEIEKAEEFFEKVESGFEGRSDWSSKTLVLSDALDLIVGPIYDDEDYKEAMKGANKALKIDEENSNFGSSILIKRSCLWILTGKDFVKALDDVNKALKMDPKNEQAWYVRGKIFFDQEQFKDALADFKKAFEISSKVRNYEMLKKTEMKMKSKDKGPSNYDILGVSKSSSIKDIKDAYRKKAKLYHPDKHSGASDELKVQMETKMKELSSAYSCLSNSASRNVYDMKTREDENEEYDPDQNRQDYADIVTDDPNDEEDGWDDVETDEDCYGGGACGCCGGAYDSDDSDNIARAFFFNLMTGRMGGMFM